MNAKIAVLLPCYNEENAIGATIDAFRQELPTAEIYVYDNNSDDDTFNVAKSCGAIVRRVRDQGKGAVVRKMFAQIEADIYVIADGDGTYGADSVTAMIGKLESENLDLVVGTRIKNYHGSDSRWGHATGNRLITGLLNLLFRRDFTDVLSGYRVMSRPFVKSIPILSDGFEIETLVTIHALEVRASFGEVECEYLPRVSGSASKLRTYQDGFRILWTLVYLFKEVKPLLFFTFFFFLFLSVGLLIGTPVVIEFFETGAVPRFPSAILASGLVLLSGISLTCGLVLDSVGRVRREMKRIHFQNI